MSRITWSDEHNCMLLDGEVPPNYEELLTKHLAAARRNGKRVIQPQSRPWDDE